MLEINAAFGQEGQNLGLVGRTGEDSARVIVCDCAQVLEEYPGAEIVCAMRRACDAEAYAHTLTADGSARRAVLTAADVAAPGSLMIEFRAVRDGQVLKSAVYVGRVERGLAGQTAAPGNPVADVIDRLNAQAEAARKAADAAQQMADEVRRKLEAGELNGSDAEVTAENIQSALGYAPVTPSALAAKQDALTDADMQSITKTGMTTGAEWTAAEQKAARERMGIDKPYELIEEIVLEDGVAVISRSPFSYPCTSVLGCVTFPVMDSSIGFFMEAYTDTNTSYVVGNRYGSHSGSVEIRFEETVKNGVLTGTAQGNVRSWGSGTVYGVNNAASLVFCEALIGVRFYTPDSGKNIPAGTKIKIYGVRA